MRLYLVQHGLAVSKEEHPERPLSEQGLREITELGRFLQDRDVNVQELYHSGKLRAQQTAQILQDHIKAKHISHLDGIKPKDPATGILDLLDHCTDKILMVGHQPFLGKLVSLLLKAPGDSVQFVPGAIVCLDSQPSWQIQWMLHPELLRT